VLPRDYKGQNCSIARTLELIGDRWTLLVLREAFTRTRRFEDFQRNLAIARNVLTDRLGRLVDDGILERRRYREHPPRDEYRLTDRGLDLWPVLISLAKWGDRHAADHGPPRLFLHRGCGGELTERLRCDRCGADLGPRDIEVGLGPGARAPAASATA
jgi:DNA-binding HxlR family transcriptional regulator